MDQYQVKYQFIYSIIYPFYLINILLIIIIIILILGLSILFLILSAFSGNSKYSILGCIRIIPQLIPSESIWSTISSFYIYSFNEISIAGFILSYSQSTTIILIIRKLRINAFIRID